MIPIIIRIAGVDNTIGISIRGYKIRRYFIYGRFNSCKLKDFVCSSLQYNIFRYCWDRYFRISRGSIHISNLYLIDTITVSIIRVVRIRWVYKYQISFLAIVVLSSFLTARVRRRLSSRDLKFIFVCPSSNLLTYLPFTYSSVSGEFIAHTYGSFKPS